MTVVFFGGVQLIILGILGFIWAKYLNKTKSDRVISFVLKTLILLYFIEMILLSFDVEEFDMPCEYEA